MQDQLPSSPESLLCVLILPCWSLLPPPPLLSGQSLVVGEEVASHRQWVQAKLGRSRLPDQTGEKRVQHMHMCTCRHQHTHTCAHTHTHMYTDVRTYTYALTLTDRCTHTHTLMRAHTHMHAHTHTLTHTQTHTHTRTHTHTHTHTHTQAHAASSPMQCLQVHLPPLHLRSLHSVCSFTPCTESSGLPPPSPPPPVRGLTTSTASLWVAVIGLDVLNTSTLLTDCSFPGALKDPRSWSTCREEVWQGVRTDSTGRAGPGGRLGGMWWHCTVM